LAGGIAVEAEQDTYWQIQLDPKEAHKDFLGGSCRPESNVQHGVLLSNLRLVVELPQDRLPGCQAVFALDSRLLDSGSIF